MAKKFEDAAAALAPLAKQFPSQTVGSNKGKGKEDATNNDDPLRPYQFYLRQSLKGELKALAASRGITMQAFILNALKHEGLSIIDGDLIDRRSRG